MISALGRIKAILAPLSSAGLGGHASEVTQNSQFRLVLSVTPCMPCISSLESVNYNTSRMWKVYGGLQRLNK